MWDIILRGLVNGALFSLIAIGLNLQYGVTRILNVAHGEFLMIGALITAVLFGYYNINPLVSLLISGPTVFAIGILVYLLAFRRLVKMSMSPEELEAKSLLACFALFFIIQNIISIIMSHNPQIQYVGVPYLKETIQIMDIQIELNRIVTLAASIIISVLLYVTLRSTRIGLALRATSQEQTGAQVIGINIFMIHMLSFGLSVLLSALAGSLMTMIFPNLSPLTGAIYTFIALTIIVIGGMGSFIGSLLGGFIIGYVYYITSTQSPLLTMPVVYVFLIIMLVVRPKGLFGR
ncbi:MAG: branched-chain amino acid ABC transporter permease [Candidatus Bathyarchaeia archaeon]